MATKSAQYKIKGMRRDESESAFSPEFAFENMNMRLTSKDKNTQLSLRTEYGTKLININDINNPNNALNIEGIVIGYGIVNDTLVLFTTTTINDDITSNTFKFTKFNFLEYTDKDIAFEVAIEEDTAYQIQENLRISCEIIYDSGGILYTSKKDLIRQPNPSVGLVYIFPEITFENAFILANIEVYYKNVLLYYADEFKVFHKYDLFDTATENICDIIFPTYLNPAVGILNGTTVTKNINEFRLSVINGYGNYDAASHLWVASADDKYILNQAPYYTYNRTTNVVTNNNSDIPFSDPMDGSIDYLYGIKFYNDKVESYYSISNIDITTNDGDDTALVELVAEESEIVRLYFTPNKEFSFDDMNISILNPTIASVDNLSKVFDGTTGVPLYITARINALTEGRTFLQVKSWHNIINYDGQLYRLLPINITAIPTPETLELLTFDFGDYTETHSGSVEFAFTNSGVATDYMISESSEFTGASWVSLDTADLEVSLSSGYGTKTLYLKLKNDDGESNTLHAHIDYLEVEIPIEVTSFDLSNSENTNILTIPFTYTANQVVQQYKISEGSAFPGCSWINFDTVDYFTLSLTDGLKTVYFKVRNTVTLEESAVVSDTITLAKYPILYLNSAVDAGNGSINIDLTNTLYATTTKTILKLVGSAAPIESEWTATIAITYADTYNIVSGYGNFDVYVRVINSNSYDYDVLFNINVSSVATTWTPNPLYVAAIGSVGTNAIITFSRNVKLSAILDDWFVLHGDSEVTYDTYGTVLTLNCYSNLGIERSSNIELDSDIGENLWNVGIIQYAN